MIAGMTQPERDRVRSMRRSMAGRWSCARKECGRAKHVGLHLHATRSGEIVETFEYACGHFATRVVGELMPDSVFAEIERRVASCT